MKTKFQPVVTKKKGVTVSQQKDQNRATYLNSTIVSKINNLIANLAE